MAENVVCWPRASPLIINSTLVVWTYGTSKCDVRVPI